MCQKAFPPNRQLKHNTIYKTYCQAFFHGFIIFFHFFKIFPKLLIFILFAGFSLNILPIFWHIRYNLSHAKQHVPLLCAFHKKTTHHKDGLLYLYRFYYPFFIYIRHRFCNSLNISSSLCPLPTAFRPNNPLPFLHRSRGISLRPNTISPARQISFRKPCIYTVKMAYRFRPRFFLIIPFSHRKRKRFSL